MAAFKITARIFSPILLILWLLLLSPAAWASGTTRATPSEKSLVISDEGEPEGYVFSVEDIEPIGPVAERARALLGDRLVDLSINRDLMVYEVGVHLLTDDESAEFDKVLSGPAPVKTSYRSVSLAQVQEVRAIVEEQASLPEGKSILNPKMGDITMIASDPAQGVVRIGGSSESLVDEMSERAVVLGLDPRLLSVEVFGFTQQSRTDYPPYKGGLVAEVSGVGWNEECSTGFTVVRSSVYYGTTSGHCGEAGRDVTIGNDYLSRVSTSAYLPTGNIDAAIYRLPAGHQTKQVYISSGSSKTVSGSYSNGELVVGTRVCTSAGISNAQICGNIYLGDVQIWDDIKNKWSYHLSCWPWENGVGTTFGDSGSPVYRTLADGTLKAAGLHAGSDGSWRSCFLGMETAMNTLNVELYK